MKHTAPITLLLLGLCVVIGGTISIILILKTNQMQRQIDQYNLVLPEMMVRNIGSENFRVCDFSELASGEYVMCFANFRNMEAFVTYYSGPNAEKVDTVRVLNVPKNILDNWGWHEIKKIPLFEEK